MIKLINNKGFTWAKRNGVSFKGYFGEFNSNINSPNIIHKNTEDLIMQIKRIKSFFAIAYENDNFLFAAVDRIRSFPLFYTLIESEIFLSDNPECLKEISKTKIDEDALKEFNFTGYVTGDKTLFPLIKQLQAGEYIIFNKETKILKKEKYYVYEHSKDQEQQEDKMIEEMDKVFLKVFKDLIQSLNHRTAVVPLSGGLDSRLIVVMLKRLGYENVVCFTYGKENNSEAQVSKKIADQLGYKWIFIPYSKKDWADWYVSEEKKLYFSFSDGLSSLPHIQDFIAVKKLKENNLVPNDSIFIPGHALDFVAGSHIPKQFVKNSHISKEQIIKQIIHKHYSLWPIDSLSTIELSNFEKNILKIIDDKENFDSEDAIDNYERWIWSERQAKFIANSLRVYEFFEYEWRLPFWEEQILSFWSKITIKEKFNRKLFKKYINIKQPEFIPKNEELKTNLKRVIISILNSVPFINKMIKNQRRQYSFENHPFEWYGLIKQGTYSKKTINDVMHINSILTDDYTKELRNKYKSLNDL